MGDRDRCGSRCRGGGGGGAVGGLVGGPGNQHPGQCRHGQRRPAPDSAAPDGTSDSASADSAWLDAGKSIPDRVEALLRKMTLPEKVGQMDQQLVSTLTDTDGTRCGDNGFNLPNPTCMQKILIDQNTGSMLAGGTNNPIDTTGQGGSRQHRFGLGE